MSQRVKSVSRRWWWADNPRSLIMALLRLHICRELSPSLFNRLDQCTHLSTHMDIHIYSWSQTFGNVCLGVVYRIVVVVAFSNTSFTHFNHYTELHARNGLRTVCIIYTVHHLCALRGTSSYRQRVSSTAILPVVPRVRPTIYILLAGPLMGSYLGYKCHTTTRERRPCTIKWCVYLCIFILNLNPMARETNL